MPQKPHVKAPQREWDRYFYEKYMEDAQRFYARAESCHPRQRGGYVSAARNAEVQAEHWRRYLEDPNR